MIYQNTFHVGLRVFMLIALATLVGCRAGAGGQFVEVTSEKQFTREVLEESRPVLVEFYRDGCVRCMMLGGTLGSLSKEYGDEVVFVKLERTFGKPMRYWYGIGSYPTVILFLNGEPKANWVNEGSRSAYRQGIDAALKAIRQGGELPGQSSAYSASLPGPATSDEHCCAERDSGPVCINPPNALTDY